eukprot:COSAG06_NODE_55674_length_288_cov_1.089947_1_plen_28_part_10
MVYGDSHSLRRIGVIVGLTVSRAVSIRS